MLSVPWGYRMGVGVGVEVRVGERRGWEHRLWSNPKQEFKVSNSEGPTSHKLNVPRKRCATFLKARRTQGSSVQFSFKSVLE